MGDNKRGSVEFRYYVGDRKGFTRARYPEKNLPGPVFPNISYERLYRSWLIAAWRITANKFEAGSLRPKLDALTTRAPVASFRRLLWRQVVVL